MPQRIGTLPEYAAGRAAVIEEHGMRPAPFDDVAPIFVYHDADLARKKEAVAAFRRMRKAGHPLVAEAASVDDVDAGLARLLYNHAFADVLSKLLPDADEWEVEIDQYGGYGCVRSDDERAFGSDGVGTFAYYLDAKAVAARCEDIPGAGRGHRR